MATIGILNLFALTDQVAFVTGGGRGLGRAICVGFAEAGADIVPVSRTVDDLEETARLVCAKGRHCLPTTCDVTVKAQVDEAVEKALSEFGKIDILVNNVGGAENEIPMEELPEEVWDRQINLNLKSAFLCSLAVGKAMMKEGRGKIVNIGSQSGFSPRVGTSVPYNVSKAGLNNFTKQLASEWGDRGIWVNCIAASAMRTPRFEQGQQVRMARGFGGVGLPRSKWGQPPAKPCLAGC